MATGHTLQPCGLELAHGLDTHDLQRFIVNYNRIARINDNEPQPQEITRVTASYSTNAIRRSVHKIKLPPTEVPKSGCQITKFMPLHDTFKSLIIKQTISRDIIYCLQ